MQVHVLLREHSFRIRGLTESFSGHDGAVFWRHGWLYIEALQDSAPAVFPFEITGPAVSPLELCFLQNSPSLSYQSLISPGC